MSLAYATKQSKKYLTIKSLIKSFLSIGTVTVLVSRKFATHARVVPGQSSIMIAARYSTTRNVVHVSFIVKRNLLTSAKLT